MAATILNLDTANLFLGDDDPDDSQFLALSSVKLPNLEEAVKEHTPGGGVGTIEIPMRKLNAIALTFSLMGMAPDALSMFMAARRQNYTVRGNMFDLASQNDIPVVGVVFGRMTKVEVSDFKKDDGVSTDYEIKGVMRYRLTIGGREKFFYDALQGPRGVRIDGVNPFARVARNIGL